MTKTWKLEDAKAHLSQLIRDAEHEPQVVTRHGKRAGVLLSPEEYDRLTGNVRSALDTFEGAPDLDVDLADLGLDRHPRADARDLDW